MIKTCAAIIISLFVLTQASQADVRSIINTPNSDSSSESSVDTDYYTADELNYDTPQNCPQAGYTRHGCPAGYRPIGECPYESGYYMGCCQPQYQYRPEDCTAAGMKPSASNCFGYYACEEITQAQ